jgi:hypothetical protein
MERERYVPETKGAWTEEKWDTILQYLRAGIPVLTACDHVRITQVTYNRWARQSEILRMDVAQAEASCKLAILLPMFDRARKNQRAAEFFLKSRWPAEWGATVEAVPPEDEKDDSNPVKDRVERIFEQLEAEAKANSAV